MNAAVVTTIFDGYDTLKPVCPQDGADVEWVLVTDDIELARSPEAEGYFVVCEPRSDDSYRAAKRPKMLPWMYTDAGASVYVDASFAVTSSTFVVEALATADPIAQFVHPWRDCAYDEATECLQLAKYASQADGIRAQVVQYRAEGHPEHWGLWASGCIARHHIPEVKTFGERWLADVGRYSHQCQVSEPPRLRTAGLRPTALTGTHLTNPWLSYLASARHG